MRGQAYYSVGKRKQHTALHLNISWLIVKRGLFQFFLLLLQICVLITKKGLLPFS